MQNVLHPILSECKAVFARNLEGFYVSEGCAVFNAPRPLLGADHSCTDWCHGRFFVEVDLRDSYASAYVQKNNDLDARVVITITDAEAVGMLLMDNARADAYREYPFEEQLEMLLPQLSKIQHLPYGEAMALIDAARAVLAADAKPPSVEGSQLPGGFDCEITLNVTFELDESDAEIEFSGGIEAATALIGQQVQVCQSPTGDLVLTDVSDAQAGAIATVWSVGYSLNLSLKNDAIVLGAFDDPAVMLRTAHQLSQCLAA